MVARIPNFRATGTAREVGRVHGRAEKDRIAENLALYFRRFREEWRLSREEVLARARHYDRVIRDADPEYAEAMEGVAEGSGQDVQDIVALNVRYEIAYSAYSQRGRTEAFARPPSGCTALALLPERTKEGTLVLAQNWDWIPGVRGLIAHFQIDGHPKVLGFTEAGIVGAKIGLNDAGVGLCINGLVSNEDAWDRAGLPFHVRCWRVLHSKSLDEAMGHVRTGLGSCSSNFLLGEAKDGRARIVDMESAPTGVVELAPKDGALVHANHFCRPKDLGIWEPLLEERTSTYQRHRLMEGFVKEASRVGILVSIEDVRTILRDHEGHPNSICRHPEEARPPSERYETIASIVMDLGARRLWISDGEPCHSPYAAFALRS